MNVRNSAAGLTGAPVRCTRRRVNFEVGLAFRVTQQAQAATASERSSLNGVECHSGCRWASGSLSLARQWHWPQWHWQPGPEPEAARVPASLSHWQWLRLSLRLRLLGPGAALGFSTLVVLRRS